MSKLGKTNLHQLIISLITIRRIVGVLSISFPAVLIIGSYFFGGCNTIQDSVSHYYYTAMRDVYVGGICAISFFLFTYKWYDKNDGIITSLTGVFLLGVAFFPTTQNADPICSTLFLEPNKLRVYIHYASAVLFFGISAYISIFLFTKSNIERGTRKRIINRIYGSCGVVLILAIILIILIRTIPFLEQTLGHLKPVFWIEWIALTAFGISWLMKGEVFFKDVVENFSEESTTMIR